MTALPALLLALVALCASSVHAQSDYPNKPIRRSEEHTSELQSH